MNKTKILDKLRSIWRIVSELITIWTEAAICGLIMSSLFFIMVLWYLTEMLRANPDVIFTASAGELYSILLTYLGIQSIPFLIGVLISLAYDVGKSKREYKKSNFLKKIETYSRERV